MRRHCWKYQLRSVPSTLTPQSHTHQVRGVSFCGALIGAVMVTAVAVASGSFIYIFKNMRPYFKFSLPSLEVSYMYNHDLYDILQVCHILYTTITPRPWKHYHLLLLGFMWVLLCVIRCMSYIKVSIR